MNYRTTSTGQGWKSERAGIEKPATNAALTLQLVNRPDNAIATKEQKSPELKNKSSPKPTRKKESLGSLLADELKKSMSFSPTANADTFHMKSVWGTQTKKGPAQ